MFFDERHHCIEGIRVMGLLAVLLNNRELCDRLNRRPLLFRQQENRNCPFQCIDIEVLKQPLVPGDKIFLATDGITETKINPGGFYGKERLERLLQTHRKINTEELVNSVVADVSAFSMGAEQSDDRTVLAFQVREGQE